MISHWYCVNCDNCGEAGPLADTPINAQLFAIDLGWKLKGLAADGEDLCPRHNRTEP